MNILLYIPSYGIGEKGKDILNFDTLGNLESAYKYWSSELVSNNSIYFAVVGGIFLPEKYQTIPISDIMMRQLINWNIPKNMIFKETKSVDSWENVKFINIELKKHFPDGLKYFDKIIIFSHKCHFRHYRIIRSYGVKKSNLEFLPSNYDFVKVGGSKDKKRYFKEFLANIISIFDPKGSWFPILLSERKKRKRKEGKSLTY
ncbi:YdcF family protein [Patescibacteria group bacterium]|nr:YdcF family protein [Patescibacteria group bacterium]